MIHRTPSGTRDVLPDEMRELRAITTALHGVFDEAGYGELYTPALEYESVERMAGGQGVYRMFDETTGEMLTLRSDMTVPIARVVGTRYATSDPPLRFCYFAHAHAVVAQARRVQGATQHRQRLHRPVRGRRADQLDARLQELARLPALGPDGPVGVGEIAEAQRRIRGGVARPDDPRDRHGHVGA